MFLFLFPIASRFGRISVTVIGKLIHKDKDYLFIHSKHVSYRWSPDGPPQKHKKS